MGRLSFSRREAEAPSVWTALFSRRMLVAFLMGFSCGLPLLLTLSVLQAWMREAGVDLAAIGLMALARLPYSAKFVWSPILDRFTPPFLGRRRGWLLMVQVGLTGAIAGLGLSNPHSSLMGVAVAALLVNFFSASQDIVVDAYRREDIPDAELGLGSSFYVYGYRIGMLLASGGGLILADYMSFPRVYLIMAAGMSVGILTTVLTPEPEVAEGQPTSLRDAVIDPFAEFFRRRGALWILGFVVAYKVGDQMAAAMTTPFYLDIGFSKSEIGTVVKLFGFWATLLGAFLGGSLILWLGINGALLVFGFLQAVSTAGFALLSRLGDSLPALAGVIAFENLSAGMGTAAYMAFMASLTNRRFTATQYALLTSFMGLSRDVITAPAGYLAQSVGWFGFFVVCTLMAAPGLVILIKIAPPRGSDVDKPPPGT
jgi:MFS transporter, PAT family, beta-lactamase induction signal transducer AmpG